MTKTHKVAKGESALQIAKKHGHQDFKAIWKAAKNRALVSKRKKPEDIQPGDAIFIPPDESTLRKAERALLESERKVLKLDIGMLESDRETLKEDREWRDSCTKNRADLAKDLAQAHRAIELFQKHLAEHQALTGQVIQELTDNLKWIQKPADSFTAAAKVAVTLGTMTAKLLKLAESGRSRSVESRKELEALRADAQRDVDFAENGSDDPQRMKWVREAKALKETTVKMLAYSGPVADFWEQVAAQSFWKTASIKKFSDVKSVTDAMVDALARDIGESIAYTKAEGSKGAKSLQGKVVEAQKLALHTRASVKIYDGLIHNWQQAIKKKKEQIVLQKADIARQKSEIASQRAEIESCT